MNGKVTILKSILLIVSMQLLFNGMSVVSYSKFNVKSNHSIKSPITLFDEFFSAVLNLGDELPDLDDQNREESEDKDLKNSVDWCCSLHSKSLLIALDLKLDYPVFANKFKMQNQPDSITQPPRFV